MRSIFGWDLPPGCTERHIDQAAGIEGPLDCPICLDGVEMDGADCAVCGNVTCAQHGCVFCQDLEKQRPIPQDDYLNYAEDDAEAERMIFADLDEHPENAITYNRTVVKKWREARGK
jgi:hypothetical protein